MTAALCTNTIQCEVRMFPAQITTFPSPYGWAFSKESKLIVRHQWEPGHKSIATEVELFAWSHMWLLSAFVSHYREPGPNKKKFLQDIEAVHCWTWMFCSQKWNKAANIEWFTNHVKIVCARQKQPRIQNRRSLSVVATAVILTFKNLHATLTLR